MNVLGVCDRDMRFVYVLPGWEGSVSDSRVLCSALTRSCPLVILPVSTNWLMRDTRTVRDFLPHIDQPDITLINGPRVVVGLVIIKSCLIFLTPRHGT